MRVDLLSDMPLRSLTTEQIESDPLLHQWRGEQIIPLQSGDRRSIEEVRRLAESDPVVLELSRIRWSWDLDDDPYPFADSLTFYEALQLAFAELELDIEMVENRPKEPYRFSYDRYDVAVRSATRPTRPRGLSALPPFTAVRYDGPPEVLIAPGRPANLRNPIVAWFAEHAAVLNDDYPALFVQFRRALAMITNDAPRPESAAELLNSTLDRIRRSVPEASQPLSKYIDADESGQLVSST